MGHSSSPRTLALEILLKHKPKCFSVPFLRQALPSSSSSFLSITIAPAPSAPTHLFSPLRPRVLQLSPSCMLGTTAASPTSWGSLTGRLAQANYHCPHRNQWQALHHLRLPRKPSRSCITPGHQSPVGAIDSAHCGSGGRVSQLPRDWPGSGHGHHRMPPEGSLCSCSFEQLGSGILFLLWRGDDRELTYA